MEWKRSYTDRDMMLVMCFTSVRNVCIGQTESGRLIPFSEDEGFSPITNYIKAEENFLCAYRFKSINVLKKYQ